MCEDNGGWIKSKKENKIKLFEDRELVSNTNQLKLWISVAVITLGCKLVSSTNHEKLETRN